MSDDRLQLAYGGLQPDRLAGLVAAYGSERAVLGAVRAGRLGLHAAVRSEILHPAADRRRTLAAAGISFVGRDDASFPKVLRGLPDAPPALFTRGRLPAGPGVAVVGTRRCTDYGKRLALDYGRAVAAAGWPLVSGLARGIDGAAHRGTVEGGGVGVAVLGSGLDVMYPREHAGLARRLIETGGAIVSEYPPDAAPLARRFPPRNRIISGLSRAVVVVEAGVKGGALITARLALDQGVAVFAVPGDVGREASRGCNLLIRDGAHPVLDADDLVEELALLLGPPRTALRRRAANDPMVAAVARSGGISADDLARDTEATIADVLARIVELEAAGLVEFDGHMVRANGH